MSLADAIERAYRTHELEPEHVLRRAVAELRLLREELDRERESSERFRRIAVEARAALAAAPVKRGDYVMVPRKPTQDMVKATWKLDGDDFHVADIYRVMIAAAPVEISMDDAAKADGLASAARANDDAPVEQAEPVAWMTRESRSRLLQGGNVRGAVPVHACRSHTATIPLYVTPQPDALRTQLDAAVRSLDLYAKTNESQAQRVMKLAEENDALRDAANSLVTALDAAMRYNLRLSLPVREKLDALRAALGGDE